MVRLILAALAVLLVAVAGFVGYRTYSFTAPPPPAEAAIPDTSAYQIDASAAAMRLGEAIRFRTVSLVEATDDRAQFEQFHAWMQARYPAFHAAARREVIGELSLMYTWEGSDAGQPPILLLAHQDVVPVPEDTRTQWQVDPFGGVIQDDAIWGRGSIDDKGSLVALLEAAEYLAAQGKRPVRTIVFAFGHDEELGGDGGAVLMAQALADRGIRAWFVLDEGLAALERHPLTGGPAAMIGISERGSSTMRVRAVGQPGHSSMPPPETAVSLLAEAIDRIHSMPIEQRLEGGPALGMMRALAPELSFTNRMAVSNEWLFGPLLKQRMDGNPAARALLGTTVAPTMVSGGSRPNVLPAEATAMINFRIHPRDTTADLLREARQAVADLDGVTVEWADEPTDASPISSTTSTSYGLIAALSQQMMPDAPVAPGLVLAGTDSRHYTDVAENVYRYQPIMLNDQDLTRPHGLNERLSVENFERMIRFYIGLMEAGAMQ
ncbi:M20/M25/M40 family metallo-hydrolase [Terricaulis silvestris]|uniref:Succinyl-diaminopimelate desuccinylase n=1 Tax=Terricaulis silvestris TaxID=2686094 RepID=A0A6I6MKB7_9CAUL|nr:M20/M25/M40 family metallo-hydrolase [Terricaulis silvestris]QGZ94401.1 Succinyl-diaminopimelate desuccinylase [Terricaulis silvestris]